MGWKCIPPKFIICLITKPSIIQNTTLSGNRVIEDIISYVRIKLHDRSGPLIQNEWCLYKKGNLDTDMVTGRAPCKDESRGGTIPLKSKECQRLQSPS